MTPNGIHYHPDKQPKEHKLKQAAKRVEAVSHRVGYNTEEYFVSQNP